MHVRLTLPRQFVLATLAGSQGHLTVEEVHGRRPDRLGMVDRATVYRTLNLLVSNRLAHGVPGPSALAYGLARNAHPHQVCRACSTVEDISPHLGRTLAAVTDNAGFRADNGGLIVYGTCATCTIGGPG